MRYQDKVTIVTGATKGIGAGICETFVENGAKVIISGIEDDEGKQLEVKLNASGPGEALYIHCDVREEDQVKILVEKTIQRYGKIDCLINNAGVHPPFHKIDDITVEGFRNLFDLNVIGYFLTCKYAMPHLRKTSGNVINNASIVAHLGQPGAMDYVSTKGAILAMTRSLALDEAEHGVRVNSFSVSSVWTPMWQNIVKQTSDPDGVVEKAKNAILLKRFGTLDEVGKLCLFLATDATYCTGIDIKISGGLELGDF